MVYCGKPSKSCAECRSRRTKCDFLTPSCSQCSRAGRTCSGYRDPSDLIFRDQTRGLAVKHRKACAAASKSGPNEVVTTSTSIASTKSREPVQLPVDSAIYLDLTTSGEEQATCYFFKNYVLDDVCTHLSFEYLLDIYNSELVGSALADSIVSLGSVGLAHFWKSPDMRIDAQRKYNSAVRLISSKLRNIETAKEDQTLITIMLLGLYETNTCDSPQSMKSWTKHINGAAALLQLRGKDQLKSPIGYRLFVHLRSQVITNCLQRHATVPAIFVEWSKFALEYETSEQASVTALALINTKFCNLRASMSSFRDYSDSKYIVAAACEIDAELAIWATHCQMNYIYSTVTIQERSKEVFSDHYHVYTNLWIATTWNYYRAVRILVNEIILTQLGHLCEINPDEPPPTFEESLAYQTQYLSSNTTILQLMHDICASVPYFLGYHSVSSGYGEMPQHNKSISGNLLLWPLYTAACTAMVSEMMRDWVVDRLRQIAEIMGIRQAAPLAHVLTLRKDIIVWQIEGVDRPPENVGYDDLESLSAGK